MDKKKGLLLGGAAAVVLALLASVAFVPMLLGATLGSMVSMGSAVGALADEEIRQEGVCTDPGPGGGAVTGTQEEYIRTMIGVAKDLGVSEDGQIIAAMVMLQESGIQNYANNGENALNFDIGTPQGTQFWLDVARLSLDKPHDAVANDADSVGLFQQRASSGWANTSEDGFKAADNPDAAIDRLLNPEYGARAFFGGPGGSTPPGLLDIEGWENMDLSVAAQKVQVSKHPSAYAKWESKARSLVTTNQDAPVIESGSGGESEGSGGGAGSTASNFAMPMKEGTYTLTSGFGLRDSPTAGASSNHRGQDFGAPHLTPIYATADGTVAAAGPVNKGFGVWIVIDHSVGGKTYSSVYGHMPASSLKVSVGDTVTQGQEIAGVGTEGTSTGDHLHFEIWDGGRFDGGTPVDPMSVVEGTYTGGGGGNGGSCTPGDTGSGASVSVDGEAGAAIEAGKSQLGVPYVWAGGELDGPGQGNGSGIGAGGTGFDCSGLTRYMIYQATGYEIGRDSRSQYQDTKGNQVAGPGDGADKLQPGDLLFWGSSAGGIHHVAMYAGDGQVIEASSSREQVRISSIEGRLGGDFFAATRLDWAGANA